MPDMKDIEEILLLGRREHWLDGYEAQAIAGYCIALRIALKNLIAPVEGRDLDEIKDIYGTDACVNIGNARAALVGMYLPKELQ